jgi:nucleotide-binding universal stress UspA family protein
MKAIVIGTDGSESSRGAIELGIELARPTAATVTVVYVSHGPSPVLGSPYYERALSEELAKGRAALGAAASLVEAAGLVCETDLLQGNPADEIANAARERDAALIVVGSRGLGAVSGTLLGSVSRHLVRDADRPVLVAPRRRSHAVAA